MKYLWIKIIILLLLISSLAFSAPPEETQEEEYISINGSIKYLAFEGGFYGIVSDDGKHYDPINLDQKFATDDLRVKVKAKLLKGIDSFHMWGSIIEIIEIDLIPAPK